MKSSWTQRAAVPCAIFVVCACVYVFFLGSRRNWTAANHPFGSHYVHLAESFLHGQLDTLNHGPLGVDDEASYKGRWFVSFPPFPSVVILPAVGMFGKHTQSALLWALLAASAPALLYVVLRFLRARGLSERTPKEEMGLVLFYAFGTPLFFSAVQGTVWFAAHVVASCLLTLYVLFALDARRPLLAGCMLGLCFLTRPTTLWAAFFFGMEALRTSHTFAEDDAPHTQALAWLKSIQWSAALRKILFFCVPVFCVGIVAMIMNWARFEDPFEFGHTYLQVRWQDRIQRWGLFHYHYLSKNLAVLFTGLPWTQRDAPYIRISTHGLALWFASPVVLAALWPKLTRKNLFLYTTLSLTVVLIALHNLLYQNTGWEQFTYRFSLDYLVFVVVLLALSARRWGKLFWLLVVWSIAINTFGAATFNRSFKYYERAQHIIFQPD